MLTGQYQNSIDEKGRILIPAKLRGEIPGNILVLTRGLDTCIWLFSPEEWRKISTSLMAQTNFFDPTARMMQRHFIAPAQEVEIDRSGRILIAPALREYAGIKKEGVLLGIQNRVEIWDSVEYQNYWEENKENFVSAAQTLGSKVSL